ncbi:MAG: ThuA domain-containing protein [Acidobacteria bacterium]|nr:ThuA domain-containing protein [Acidobacteriota bacterium]MCW5970541.1 ThuA domain-containing protein [Blastocatellales bacterium]
MKHKLTLLCLLALLFGLAAMVRFEAPVTSVEAKAAPRVVYVTQSKGFRHQVLHLSEGIVEELGAKHGFDVHVTHMAEKVITPETLKNTDVIIFYTTGELPLSDAQKTMLLDFIKGGKAFIGIHSATDTFYKWPEYGEMINGYFDGHPWTQDTEVTIRVDDRTHPTTRHLPESMTFKEEIYQFKQFSPDRVKVLASLDAEKTDMKKNGVKASSFPLVWYRNYGKGRVYYNALGHRPDIWTSDWYQTMLVQTIKWSLGETR